MGIWLHQLVALVNRHRVCALLLGAAFVAPVGLAAQDTPVDARQPIATRAQLQEAMEAAEAIANSPAYSADFRETKRSEAAQIRERLLEGDFYIGDHLIIVTTGMTGDSGIGGQAIIRPGRVLTLGALPDIPMRGVLRSEAEEYLTAQIRRYVIDAQVQVRPLIRLTFMGGIKSPGFYQMDADIMLSDALMQAGGISNGTDLKRSKILRGEDELVDGETFAQAVTEGVSLDHLNLRAGDVIEVGQVNKTNWFSTLRTYAIIPGLIISTYGVGKLFGIF